MLLNLIVLWLSVFCVLPHGTVSGLQSVIVAFPGNTHLIDNRETFKNEECTESHITSVCMS